ncbi:MAG: hypothetical protein SGPRY_010679, partial [Prymnesium sp.]
MQAMDRSFGDHGVGVHWAVIAHDDGANLWSHVKNRSLALEHVKLILTMNASSKEEPLQKGELKAKLYLQRRLVRSVWNVMGRSTYQAIWLPDDDIRFDLFDIPEFFHRWRCAFATGPPIVSQPPVDMHGIEYQRSTMKSWPNTGETWQLCLSNQFSREVGFQDEPCFMRDTLALRIAYIEIQAPLLDAEFLAWFFDLPIVNRIVQLQRLHHAAAGPDAIWCGAAAEWATQTNSARTPCAVVTVPIGHDDTQTISARSQNYFRSIFSVLSGAKIRASPAEMRLPLKSQGCNPAVR